MKKRYIIFGTGNNGKEVYSHLKREEVAFFCDNNIEKVGQKIDGIEIISFEKLLEIYHQYVLILAIGNKFDLRRQFEKNGITDYIEYQDDAIKRNNNRNDSSYKVMKTDSKMNELLDLYVEKCNTLDTLNNFNGFRELVAELKTKLNGEYAFYESAYNESIMYGHAKALMDYAKIQIDYANFPIVAHGMIYAGTHPDYHTAAIFSGIYDKQIHNARYPYVPIFSVGPYIHYARNIYSKDVLSNIKEKNGKTAVFFITHSAEQSFVLFDEQRILNEILNHYSKIYNTVLVCAYWCDIDKEIYKKLTEAGIQVVSAGFRFDTRFIQRLRTIMELGDDIYVYGFTSALFYAFALEKNLYLGSCREIYDFHNTPKHIPVVRFQDSKEYYYIKQVLLKAEDKKIELSREEKERFDLYFGFDQIKTAEEIKKIYEISYDIWENCDRLERRYPIGVYKTYEQYQKNYDFEKLHVLTQSLGKGFWNI